MFLTSCCPPSDWRMQNEVSIQPEDSLDIYYGLKSLSSPPKMQPIKYDVVDDPKSLKSVLEDDVNDGLFESMKHEKNRLNSFNGKWPLNFIKSSDLSESGFFYLQFDDRVQCAFCSAVIFNWKVGDKPLKEHIKKSPKCPFLITSVGNVPVANHRTSATSSYCSQYVPMPSSSSASKPKNPRMADIKRRLSTFKGWPLTMIGPEELADCGLYYTGVADVVTCFFCGGSLGNWEPFDDPMSEHSKFYPNCVFLRLLRSRPIQKKKSVSRPFDTVLPTSAQSVKQVVASEFLKSDVVKQAMEIFPSSIVQDVVLQHLKQSGQTFTSLHQLCEKILEHDEKKHMARINGTIENKDISRISHQPGIFNSNGTANDVKDIFLCKICMDKEMGIVFQPCGHLVTCESCAALISECPLCRKPIETTVRTYLS